MASIAVSKIRLTLSAVAVMIVAGLLSWLDLFTKVYVENHLKAITPVVGDIVRIHYIRNYSVLFNFLDKGNWLSFPRTIFVIGTIYLLVIFFLDNFYKPSKKQSLPNAEPDSHGRDLAPALAAPHKGTSAFIFLKNTFHWFAIPLLIAGALGNIVDRMLHDYVIDFIEVGPSFYKWPIFNLADAYIFIPLMTIIYVQVRELLSPPKEAPVIHAQRKEPSKSVSKEFLKVLWLDFLLAAGCALFALSAFFLSHYEPIVVKIIHIIQIAFTALLVPVFIGYFVWRENLRLKTGARENPAPH